MLLVHITAPPARSESTHRPGLTPHFQGPTEADQRRVAGSQHSYFLRVDGWGASGCLGPFPGTQLLWQGLDKCFSIRLGNCTGDHLEKGNTLLCRCQEREKQTRADRGVWLGMCAGCPGDPDPGKSWEPHTPSGSQLPSETLKDLLGISVGNSCWGQAGIGRGLVESPTSVLLLEGHMERLLLWWNLGIILANLCPLFVSPAGSFLMQVEGACFIFLLNKLVTPFGFSHTGQHIKTCLSALENVPVDPDPLEKHSFGQLQEVGPRTSLWSPLVAGGTLPKGSPKRGGERIYGEPTSVIKMDSFIRS